MHQRKNNSWLWESAILVKIKKVNLHNKQTSGIAVSIYVQNIKDIFFGWAKHKKRDFENWDTTKFSTHNQTQSQKQEQASIQKCTNY